MDGLHLTADLHACAGGSVPMTEPEALRRLCLDAVREAGLQAVGELFHHYPDAHGKPSAGVTGVVLLAESHLALHTWPELGAVTIDVYVCNFGADNSERARALMDRLVSAFAPAAVERHALNRGSRLAGGAAA
jgi:S-adenosylmethionine decarboxylase